MSKFNYAGPADELYWLSGYLHGGADNDPAKYSKAFEAISDFKSDFEGVPSTYNHAAFRAFAKGLFCGGIIEIEDLDDIDQMIADRLEANK